MAGYILLEGGQEFSGGMSEPDRRAIQLAGGPDVPIGIIPAAAAPDNNHEHAGSTGKRWFNHLGARDVSILPLIDRVSADRPSVLAELGRDKLIFLLGGFTHYLAQSLIGSRGWQAILAANRGGAVVAGSSAGAMVLCEYYYNPENSQVYLGLGLVPNACVMPHHNSFGKLWAPRLAALLPRGVLIGLDEHTGIINDGNGGAWRVYGSGAVTLYRQGQPARYSAGKEFSLE
jgi:cyanophycinase